jgi:hypothetical protein
MAFAAHGRLVLSPVSRPSALGRDLTMRMESDVPISPFFLEHGNAAGTLWSSGSGRGLDDAVNAYLGHPG